MNGYLDPKNDLVFKRIFAENAHLTKSFLNALMPLDKGRTIEEVHFLSPENIPDTPFKKLSIVDVRCTDNLGRKFIIEMQTYWNRAFYNRMMMNTSRTFSRQLDRGEKFARIQPVYGLGILNAVFDHKTSEYYHRFQMSNRKNTEEVIEGIEIVMVELPKFKPETFVEKRMAVLWLRFLKEIGHETLTVPKELLDNAEIVEALAFCREGAYTPIELEAYDNYWLNIATEQSYMDTSFYDGEAEGEARGLARGKVEASMEIARNLMNLGMSIDDIAKSVGLSVEEIRKLG